MSKVRILPEILSNKIAAGEVVERPASVIKELIENSLDAGSTVINIEVEKGGKSLIRISDNGSGMSTDDALLAIERYATSKIYNDEDLFSINTLGFRGEALPSIASVSRFTLTTRPHDSDIATEIYIEGGKVKNVTETGAPPGTMISIAQLFFNTPARRKFLKTINTEMGHISDIIASIALGWPKVQFRLTHNQKIVKSWPSTNGSFNRAVDVLGTDLRSSLQQIEFADNYLKIDGWLSSPDMNRSTSNKIYIYINGRYIKDRKLLHALLQGFGSRLMKGRFPIGVLFIEIPYDQLDVNVHPTKHEVRFADHQRVYDAVKSSVSDSLKLSDKNSFLAIAPKHDNNEKTALHSGIKSSWGYVPNKQSQSINEGSNHFEPSNLTAKTKISIDPPLPQNRFPSIDEKEEQSLTSDDQKDLWDKKFFAELTILGQLQNTYILCDSGDGLIIIDQHAAHERIVFEKLKKKNTKVESQALLIPETVELGYKEATALIEITEELSEAGLDIEPFGGNTFTIRSVPSILSDGSISNLIVEIAEALVESGHTKTLDDILEECLILMACHSSIRAKQSLQPTQMRHLLTQLDECETPSFCPHGRPTWVKWSKQSLEKSFRR